MNNLKDIKNGTIATLYDSGENGTVLIVDIEQGLIIHPSGRARKRDIPYCIEHGVIRPLYKEDEKVLKKHSDEWVKNYINRYHPFNPNDLINQYSHLGIKVCPVCGKSFIPNTKGIYCEDCKRDLSSRNHEKYERRKTDPQRQAYTKRYQAIAGRLECKQEGFKTYHNIFIRLANENNKSLEWFKEWDEFDKQYQELRKKLTKNLITTKQWEEKLKEKDIKTLRDFKVFFKEINSHALDNLLTD